MAGMTVTPWWVPVVAVGVMASVVLVLAMPMIVSAMATVIMGMSTPVTAVAIAMTAIGVPVTMTGAAVMTPVVMRPPVPVVVAVVSPVIMLRVVAAIAVAVPVPAIAMLGMGGQHARCQQQCRGCTDDAESAACGPDCLHVFNSFGISPCVWSDENAGARLNAARTKLYE